MTDKPEALRLACLLEDIPVGQMLIYRQQAATELRRLHEVNEVLLEALTFIANHDLKEVDDRISAIFCDYFITRSRAAIAKATGGKA